jgi:hypothetical protein
MLTAAGAIAKVGRQTAAVRPSPQRIGSVLLYGEKTKALEAGGAYEKVCCLLRAP